MNPKELDIAMTTTIGSLEESKADVNFSAFETELLALVKDEIKVSIAKIITGLKYQGAFNPEKVAESLDNLKRKYSKTYKTYIMVLFAASTLVGYTDSPKKIGKLASPKLVMMALAATNWTLGPNSEGKVTVGQVESCLPTIKLAVLAGMEGQKSRFSVTIGGQVLDKLPIASEWGYAFLTDSAKVDWEYSMKERSKIISNALKFRDCLITYYRSPKLKGPMIYDKLEGDKEDAKHTWYDSQKSEVLSKKAEKSPFFLTPSSTSSSVSSSSSSMASAMDLASFRT